MLGVCKFRVIIEFNDDLVCFSVFLVYVSTHHGIPVAERLFDGKGTDVLVIELHSLDFGVLP